MDLVNESTINYPNKKQIIQNALPGSWKFERCVQILALDDIKKHTQQSKQFLFHLTFYINSKKISQPMAKVSMEYHWSAIKTVYQIV